MATQNYWRNERNSYANPEDLGGCFKRVSQDIVFRNVTHGDAIPKQYACAFVGWFTLM